KRNCQSIKGKSRRGHEAKAPVKPGRIGQILSRRDEIEGEPNYKPNDEVNNSAQPKAVKIEVEDFWTWGLVRSVRPWIQKLGAECNRQEQNGNQGQRPHSRFQRPANDDAPRATGHVLQTKNRQGA